MLIEKYEDCPRCEKAWASQSHYDMQRCDCMDKQSKFIYELNDTVTISVTNEQASVVGRAEYNYCEPQYFLRYKGNDGSAHEHWWTQSALTK